MQSSRALYKIADFDAAFLLANLQGKLLPATGKLWEAGDRVDGIAIHSEGTIRHTAETCYGPHEVLTLGGPFIAGLAELGLADQRLCRVELSGAKQALFVQEADVHTLLLEDSRLGVAMRRLCLYSLDRALRACNEQLFAFFGQTSDGPVSGPIYFQNPDIVAEKPADPVEIRDFFDIPEAETEALGQLAFVKRMYRSGGRLAKRGTPSDEAFFIRTGKVRVSLRIPGVGEEALTILGPGQIAGELALIDDSLRSADLISHEGPVKVYVLKRSGFRKLMSGSISHAQSLGTRIVSALCFRFAESIERSISFFMLGQGSQPDEHGRLPLDSITGEFEFRKPVD